LQDTQKATSTWGGSTTTTGKIYRNGAVAIGTTTPRDLFDIWGGTMYITGSDFNGTLVGGSQSGIAYVGCNTLTNGISINSNANVGIGTTSIGSFKMAVEGKIGAREIRVTSANPFPDYVFAPTYKLPSLASVEAYINKTNTCPVCLQLMK